jgi:hypothetical protein
MPKPKKPSKGAAKYRKIHDLYIDLHGSADLLNAYHTSPDLFIKKTKLSQAKKRIVLTGDALKIRSAIEAETGNKVAKFSWVF